MVSEQDFRLLLAQDKESLIALVMQLLIEVDELRTEKPLSLPELPPVGRYVIRDARGVVLMAANEDKSLIRQMEVQALILSMCGKVFLQFCLNGESRLLSEWNNGKRIARCQ